MSHADCGCGDLCAPGSSLEATSKQLSRVINARVSQGAAKALIKYCAANGCSQSTAIRVALAKLAKESGDPDAQLAAVASVFGLGKDATPDVVEAAFRALLTELRTPEDPLAGVADTPHGPSSDEAAAEGDKAARGVQKFIREQNNGKAVRAELYSRGMIVHRDRLVTLSKATLDAIKAKGMTIEEYERGVNSVRRAGR